MWFRAFGTPRPSLVRRMPRQGGSGGIPRRRLASGCSEGWNVVSLMVVWRARCGSSGPISSVAYSRMSASACPFLSGLTLALRGGLFFPLLFNLSMSLAVVVRRSSWCALHFCSMFCFSAQLYTDDLVVAVECDYDFEGCPRCCDRTEQISSCGLWPVQECPSMCCDFGGSFFAACL